MTSAHDQAWTMMAKIDFCMLVTHASGGLRSRPMSSIVKQDEGRIYFLTDAINNMIDEVATNRDVLLCYSNGASQFVSTAGTAEKSSDRALIKRLWNPGAQSFWPDGPDDQNVVALIVTPVSADFWEGHGTIVSAVKFAVALVTGTTPDMGTKRKISL